MNRRFVLLAVLAGACSAPANGPHREPPRPPEPSPELLRDAAAAFHTVRDGFLEWYLEAHPVRSTRLGLHEYDHRLQAMDRVSIQRRIDALLDWEARLQRIPIRLMRDDDRFDHAVLEYAIRAELLEGEEVRRWASDPRVYTSQIAAGLASVAERRYAPLQARVESLRGRLEEAPAILLAARENVRNAPRLWTELSIGEARGLLHYVESSLPAVLSEEAAAAAGGGATLAAIEPARAALVSALREQIAWLEQDLLRVSTGDYRLGQYMFSRKLLYEEHVDLSIQELTRLNEEGIAEYRGQLEAVAAEIDPNRTAREVMDSIARLHPAPHELIETARRKMLEAREWVGAADIVTLPSGRMPVVRETPAYARRGFASMDAPGPFETEALDAYYNITNVDPAWPAEQQRQHLTYFNYPGLLGITVHETFPGHFLHGLHQPRVPSDLRKVFTARTLSEGWAHYVEQMALDEGFRAGDLVARLGQVRRALQRHARWDAALQIHVAGRSVDETVQRFMDIAHFEEFPARREVVRATYDPTYLHYALGRMQILTLRREYEVYLEERGETFSLRAFHDRLLELGLPPSLATEALMPPARPPAARTGRR